MGAQDDPLSLDNPIYDPFRREDQYGILGRQPQSLLETIRLWTLIALVAPLKFTGCFLCVAACWLVCRCGALQVHLMLLLPDPHSPHKLARLCRFSFLLPEARRQTALVSTCKALVGGCLWSLGFQKRTWRQSEGFQYDAEHTALAKDNPRTGQDCSVCPVLDAAQG